MLIFTTNLNHPLVSRTDYLVHYLLEKQNEVKVLDFSFYNDNPSFAVCFRNILLFPKSIHLRERIIHFPSITFLGNGKGNCASLTHLLHSILSFLLAKIITAFIDYDIVVSTDPIAGVVAIFSTKSKKFLVYDDLDYFEDLQHGQIQRAVVSFSEKYCLKSANLVSSVSRPLVRRARLLNSHCILIPNGVDLKCFKDQNNLQRQLFIIYAGSLDEWAGLKLVIESFSELRSHFPEIKMLVAGDGKEKFALQALVQSLALQDSILFLGRIQYSQLASLLSSAYIGIAMFKPGNAAAFACPLKLFDYMAAGVPIIATDIGELGRVVTESKSGLVTKWDKEEFVAAVVQLSTKKDLWLSCHENGLRYAQRYDWVKLFDGWLQEIETRL